MARTVKCVLLGVEAEGLDYAPYPGELGQRIYENVSKEGWQHCLKHQTMLLNEYRLTPIDPKARKFLVEEMEKFFFGGGSQTPKEFVDPDSKPVFRVGSSTPNSVRSPAHARANSATIFSRSARQSLFCPDFARVSSSNATA